MRALTPSRNPVRWLALVTGVVCLAAQALSRVGDAAGGPDAGPWGAVVGQTLWNAAQVGLLLLLLCLCLARRSWWAVAAAVAAGALLPFAIYVMSPGGWALSLVLLATCVAAWATDVPDFSVAVVDAPARGTPMPAKFEFLAFVCTLLCSIYNGAATRSWPPWNTLFARIAGLIGFTPDGAAVTHAMYTLGLPVGFPAYIAVGKQVSNLSVVVFALIWAILPFLYVLYFAVLAKLAKDSPGARIQRALCFVCMFHFLFLTDIVAYRFGRGIENPAANWAHWIEVFVWRVAILLPVYQKVVTRQYLRGSGLAGVVMHYALAAWAVGFFVYEVLVYNVPSFVEFALDPREMTQAPFRVFGQPYSDVAGYHGALVVMTLAYAVLAFAMPCKRIAAQRLGNVTPLAAAEAPSG